MTAAAPDLAARPETKPPRDVAAARDVAAMPGFTATYARAFDMFPHTSHHEVLTLLVRES